MKLKNISYLAVLYLTQAISMTAMDHSATAAAGAGATKASALTTQALVLLKKKQEQAKQYEPVIKDLQKVLGSEDPLIKIIILRILNDEPIENINQPFGKSQNTLLMGAVSLDNPSLLQSILRYKPDVNQQNKTGETALHYAALLGVDPNITQALVYAGAQVDKTNSIGETPLHMGARYIWWHYPNDKNAHYIKTLQIIIKASIEKNKELMNAKMKEDFNPLVCAIIHYNFLAVHILLKYNADKNQPCKGQPAIAHAMNMKINVDQLLNITAPQRLASIDNIIRHLLEPSETQPSKAQTPAAAESAAQVKASETPVGQAVAKKIQEQPAGVADAKAHQEDFEEPYIHIYSKQQLRDSIQSGALTINAPLDPEADNRTILCWAAIKNDLKLAVLAIANGFNNFFAQDADGENALTLAAYHADPHFLRLLLTFIPADTCARDGSNALLSAVQGRKLENIKVLAEHIEAHKKEAFFNKQDISKMTPLIAAIYQNDPKIVAELLRHGAHPLDQGQAGSPLAIASNAYKHKELVAAYEGQPESEISRYNQHIIHLLVISIEIYQRKAQDTADQKAKEVREIKRKNKQKERAKAAKPSVKMQPRGKAKAHPQQPVAKQEKEDCETQGKTNTEVQTPPAQRAPCASAPKAMATSQPASNADLIEGQLALHESYAQDFDRIIKHGTKEEAERMRHNYRNLLLELQRLNCPRKKFTEIHRKYFLPLFNKAKQQ